MRSNTPPCLIEKRGFLAHPLRRNSKNGVSEVPLRRNSVSGIFEVPVRSDTPPCLIYMFVENEVFWHTPCAETQKTEFLRFQWAETPVVQFWGSRAQRYSTMPYRERSFLAHPCAETPKTEFLRFPCAETPLVEFLRFPCGAILHRAL